MRAVATGTETSPQSNNQITATDSGAGDNDALNDDWHKVELDLKDSNGNVIGSKSTRTLESA